MTLNRLHNLLGTLIRQGYGRRAVCIDKSTFKHKLEADGCTILDVCRVDVQTNEVMDDDGGWATRADGTNKVMTTVVLGGSAADFGDK